MMVQTIQLTVLFNLYRQTSLFNENCEAVVNRMLENKKRMMG